MWLLSRSQLDDSVMQQANLASVALERWLDDQKKALDAIAALAGDKDTRTPTIHENLENVLHTRPFWLDLRITNAAGTTAPGVGLGLYLAQHIVGQLDGEITVESKEGAGTTFTVLLPMWVDDNVEAKEETHVKALVGG